MLLIDSPPPSAPSLTPAELLALDDLLLDLSVAGSFGEWLRLWEAPRHFVVLGRHGKPAEECHAGRCRRDGIAVLRRLSGGGTVLQGPGCLNFSLALDARRDQSLQDVRESYQVVLGRVARALQGRGIAAEIACCVDLAVGGMKISGNAQLRRRGWLLHHGTLLCGFDLAKVSLYLKHPPKEPPYRRGRPHEGFMINLPLASGELAAMMRGAFVPADGVWRLDDASRPQLTERAKALSVPVF